MKKIIRLTESDLETIVKRVINEQNYGLPNFSTNLGGIKSVQQALINKGYSMGKEEVDGILGPNTKKAIIAYQNANNIKPTGNVGPITAKSLGVQPLTSVPQKNINKQSVIGTPNYGLPNFSTNLGGIKGIQQALINKGYSVGKDEVDGTLGLDTKRAIMKYQKDNGITPTGNVGPITAKSLGIQSNILIPKKNNKNSNKNSSNTSISKNKTNGGFILIWAFPEYQPKVDGKSKMAQFFGSLIRISSGGEDGKKGTYGKLGHGGCVVIKPNGESICFEFGRYPGAKKNYGKVLTHPLGKIAKIKNGIVINPEEVAIAARKVTYAPGPSMKMTVAVVKLPDPIKSIDYASIKEREYSALDFSIGGEANCGTFARDVAVAGGVLVGSFCFPTPISVVNSFKNQSDKFFEV